MKKMMCAFAFAMLLTGCGQRKEEIPDAASVLEPTETTAQSTAAASETDEEIDVNVIDTVYYDTVEDFLASDFCTRMEQNGYTPYLLSYDEERYEFYKMYSDASFYVYSLLDTVTNEAVDCTIEYQAYERSITQIHENKLDKSGDQITAAEKDGVTYDVYISKTPYVDYDEYSMIYLPMDGYKMSIHPNTTTPEAALAYIHEFTLVPAE